MIQRTMAAVGKQIVLAIKNRVQNVMCSISSHRTVYNFFLVFCVCDESSECIACAQVKPRAICSTIFQLIYKEVMCKTISRNEINISSRDLIEASTNRVDAKKEKMVVEVGRVMIFDVDGVCCDVVWV